MKIIITLGLIVIQWPSYDGFPAPLAARISLPFHLHAKGGNFWQKEILVLVHQGSNPYHVNVKSMHNHLTNSCFMMINIIL